MGLSSCFSAAGSPDLVLAGDTSFAEDAVDFGGPGFAEYDPAFGPQNAPGAPDFHPGAFDRDQQNAFHRALDFPQGAREAEAL